jgi:phage tail sheath protein FI
VFEPNDQRLWLKLERDVSLFLTRVYYTGALFGATAADSFFVKCDAETNPPAVRDVGQVITDIGVAPVKPAEFVIFRIGQYQPGSEA